MRVELQRIVAIAARVRRPRRRTRARHSGQGVAAKLTHAATDRRVRRDARRTAVAASRAARRTHGLGLTRALSDRRVSRDLRRTRRHATRATRRALRPQAHRKRTATLITAAVGTLVSAAYAGTRKPR
jgi:hypothetical protein